MKRICKALSIIALAMAIAGGMIGCTKEPVIAIIDGEKISEPLYRIFLWSTERGLEAIVPNIWEIDSIEGKTPEEFAKDRAIKSVTYYVAVEQKAEEVDIKLSKKEKEEIKMSVKEVMVQNDELVKEYGIKDDDFEKFLEYGKLEEKVIEQIGNTYVPNDDEIDVAKQSLLEEGAFSKTATTSHILFRNKNELGEPLPEDKNTEVLEKAQKVLDDVLQGKDINELAVRYSEDETVSQNQGRYTFTKGEMEKSIEDIVFKPTMEGQVYQELVQTSFGYEIIKVENVSEIEEQVKQDMAIQRVRQEFMSTELIGLSESYVVEKSPEYDQIHVMKINNKMQD